VHQAILGDAIFDHEGHITADEFAALLSRSHRDKQALLSGRRCRKHVTNKVNLRSPAAYAGVGNNPSSSSAMAIRADGNYLNRAIPDARRERPTKWRAFDPLGSGRSPFCRDAACGMAAASAER